LDGAVGRFEQSDRRLRALASAPALRGADVGTLLREHGVSRRSFLGWASATAAALMLPDAFAPRIARAAEVLNRIPVIWIEGQDCAGNTEALLRTSAPTIDELLFQTISLEYHETLMAAAGMQAQERKANAVQAFKGKYVLVIEGAVPNGLDGTYCTVGPAAKPFRDEVVELAEGAALVIAAGACAFYGGIPVAAPNPTDAVGVSSVVHGKPLVNVPACPLNPANLIGVLLHYAMTGQPPALDGLLRPKFAFGYRIHDNCERRAHFEAGEFVQDWGDQGARNNWCLYRMGCKGPMTNNNCSIIRYNDATNWPIGVGHGCIGCAEVGFWDRYAQERPLANAGIPAAGFFGLGVEKSVDRFGLGLLTAAAAGVAIHAGVSMTLRRRAAAAAAGTPAPTADATSPSEEPS
jgi:quinone-reactive Ni/Fe-hydrogenase small subunit